jgi:Na+/H+-translocating membrane pyrophosphatase
MQASTKTVPRCIRRRVSRFGRRHVKGVAAVRVLVALRLIALGCISCAYGYRWGALLFVAAGLVGWLTHPMPRWEKALDAEIGASPRLTKRDATT